MKHISLNTTLLLLAFTLFFASCKKTGLNEEPHSTFSFMAGNTLYTYNGILNDKQGAIVYMPMVTGEVVLKGQNTDLSYLRAVMYTSTLSVGSYTASAECHLNTNNYQSQGNFTVTIISYSDGLVSGIFSGEVYEPGATAPLLITNGNFHDLKIEYTL
ncbi:MAG: hypothetical protein ABI741_09995 [Ferruginibacter sp.]